MKKINKAFTFVEMIVVITIIAILSTIGFTVFQRYIDISRDTNRIVQLSEIEDGFDLLSVTTRLPLPESMASLQVGTGTTLDTFAFQGYAGEAVMKAIGYTAGGRDPEYGVYPSYMLSKNRKDFQLLTFVQDSKYLSHISGNKAYAEINYLNLFPKVAGDSLGILLDSETAQPLQEMTTNYNISTGTGIYTAYFSDRSYISGSSGSLLKILPTQNCKRIKELGNSKGSGIYTIYPLGLKGVSVYCEMEIDGGGWTLAARSQTGATGNFGWFYGTGSIYTDSKIYSFGTGIIDIQFDSLLLTSYLQGKKIEKAVKVNVENNFISNTGTLQSTQKTNNCEEVYPTDISWVSACDPIGEDGRTTEDSFLEHWGYFHASGSPNLAEYFFRANANTYLNHGLDQNGYKGSTSTNIYDSSLGEFRGQQGMLFVK